MSPHIAVLLASTLLTSGGRDAHERRVGDWVVNLGDGVQMASVTNDAGASAGILCSLQTEGCAAFLITTTTCEEGSTIPMMLNSSVGSGVIRTTCRHLAADDGEEPTAMSVVAEYGTMKQALESGGTIGVAIPMASGAFRVLRFSTAGATAAMRAAMTVPPGQHQDPDVRPVKDMSEL